MTNVVKLVQNSLTAKLILAIAAAGVLLVFLTSVMEIAQEERQLIATEKREARAAVSANIDTLALAIWSFDQRAMEITARSLVRRTSIFRVEVREDGNTILKLDRSDGSIHPDFYWETPLLRPNTQERIGTLQVSESYADVRQQIKKRAASLVAAELAKVLGICAVLFFFVHAAVTRPLSTLARKLRTAGFEEGEKISVTRPFHSGHDQIDALVDAINSSNEARNRLEVERRRAVARQASAGKLEALGRLAGGVAHDFNNLLGAIMGFGGLLAQDLPAGSMQHRFAQRILSACERGKALVEQIRAFARADAAERHVLDLQRVMRQNESFLAASLPKSTRLSFIYEDGELPVLSSEARLGQLITNMCINASEALEGKEGQVTVEVGRASQEEVQALCARGPVPGEYFEGTVHPAAEFARLRVCDTGGGIPPDVLERIFDPFFTTKGRQQGTGLGLAVVHGVIESLGGACHVTSQPGAGAIFSVYLPLESRISPAPPAAIPESPDLRGRERILIVDDEEDIVEMLSIGLSRLGYETVGVNDPALALSAFKEDPMAWDVVVTDQAMPDMRGLELIGKMKTIRPGIKTVLCTGYSDGASEDLCRAAGADAFLLKPLDAARIAPSLRRLMDGGAG